MGRLAHGRSTDVDFVGFRISEAGVNLELTIIFSILHLPRFVQLSDGWTHPFDSVLTATFLCVLELKLSCGCWQIWHWHSSHFHECAADAHPPPDLSSLAFKEIISELLRLHSPAFQGILHIGIHLDVLGKRVSPELEIR